MSRDVCPTLCTHGKGLSCNICWPTKRVKCTCGALCITDGKEMRCLCGKQLVDKEGKETEHVVKGR